ncbi:MAG: hypothetical protein MMC33_007382 [Icmadophila ericetorum]|nr:hypothetical protein [Icmadophila ericetorum]
MKSFKSYFSPEKKDKEEKGGKEKSARISDPLQPASSFQDIYEHGKGTDTPSSRGSWNPLGDGRRISVQDMAAIRADVSASWLHTKQQRLAWTTNLPGEGVVIKQTRDAWTSSPSELSTIRGGLYDAVTKLNVRVAMTVTTHVIRVFLQQEEQQHSIHLDNGLALQVIPTIAHLPYCQKHHSAAFIQDTASLVVWDDNPSAVLSRAAKIERQLIALISSHIDKDALKRQTVIVTETEKAIELGEEGQVVEKPRRVALIHAVLSGLTLILLMAAIGAGWRQVAVETGIDQKWIRLAFVAVVPFQMWLGLFFMQSVVICIAQLVGPVGQSVANSKFYSGAAPARHGWPLPHVTVQCPVFKEGLNAVITPTVRSIKAAIATYEMQGGTANIFINDDGLQLISAREAELRRDYYEENNIGWVARPRDSPEFVRPGRFKKASNLNYALAVSNRIEEKLATIKRLSNWNEEDESEAYAMSLKAVIDEDEGRTWAEGNVRIGDYILLIDSDTRVPADCFMAAVQEMEQSPEVAIIQFPSGVLNVTNTFFENGISFFTSLVYTVISYIVACGDIPPFVGHNALLRWSAIQEVALASESDPKVDKYWSENTVSEDFEMALRLQTAGYQMRLAAYKGTEFKEGVSLTVYDELARWKKYAYGCSELLFHPLRHWFTRGPFTPLFRKFMSSSIPLPSKLGIMAYIGTYYAIGSAWLLITANYFLVGWYTDVLDHYYINSFEIIFSIIIVFSGVSNISLAVLRYRTMEKGLISSLFENFKWVILLFIFFGGISMHVSEALLSHLFSINVHWGSTAKELEDTTFFIEVAKLIRRFKVMFGYCIVMIAAMIYLARFAPIFWRIDSLIAILPLSSLIFTHIMLPIALNPSLMLFTW